MAEWFELLRSSRGVHTPAFALTEEGAAAIARLRGFAATWAALAETGGDLMFPGGGGLRRSGKAKSQA